MIQLPKSIEEKIQDKHYVLNQTGMSGAMVLCFKEQILKISQSGELEEEYQKMRWLEGRLLVPQAEALEKTADGRSYLLMSRMPGLMSCDANYLEQPDKLIRLLAEGLKQLWQVDISDCPFKAGLDEKLSAAKKRVELQLCDVENVEKDTYGANGFENPAALLEWLQRHRPKEDFVFSHGDYCLPNVFFKDNRVSGYIDLGGCGIADRYQDIALCYRSLIHNFDGTFETVKNSAINPNLLFDYLKITPDWQKIRYYILLDELF